MDVRVFYKMGFGYEDMSLLFSTDSSALAWFFSPLALNGNIKSELSVTELL